MVTAEKLIAFGVMVVALNIPFGYWRANTQRFSLGWVLAIHVPVPIVIVMRLLFGLNLYVLPLSALFFFAGQLAGARLRTSLTARVREPTSCLVLDLAGLAGNRRT